MRLLLLSTLLLTACSNPITTEFIYNPSQNNSSLGRLYTDNSGAIFMNWVEQHGDTAFLYYSKFEDKSWSSPSLISSSNEWFVNWADFPSVISHDGQPLAAHWLKKTPGHRFSYNVEVQSFSKQEPLVPHTDGTASEHGFVSMAPVSDSTFYAIWLDGRNMVGGHGDASESHDEIGSLDNAMTIRGALISATHELLEEHEIDNAVCECCNTTMINTPNGLIAAYRNRTEEEIRDIYVARYENGSWTKGTPVFDDEWKIGGCPVNGPMLANFEKTIALGWFTGAEDVPRVKLSFSENSGQTFSDPVYVDVEVPLGRVDVAMIDAESAWISWITRNEDSALLKLKHINKNGKILEELTISEIDPSRSTGFPQLTSYGSQLLMAWTDISGKNSSLKTAIIR